MAEPGNENVPADEPDQVFIGCLSVQMGRWNPGSVAEGAVEKICDVCGTGVFLALAGQKMLREKPDAKLVCMQCVIKLSEESEAKGDKMRIGAVPGAIQEAIENIARNEARKNQS